ncbi:hypothetical protein [Neisseria sp.]
MNTPDFCKFGQMRIKGGIAQDKAAHGNVQTALTLVQRLRPSET